MVRSSRVLSAPSLPTRRRLIRNGRAPGVHRASSLAAPPVNQKPRAGESQGMSETPQPVVRSFAHLSDEAVVALVARSDDTALAELYDRFGRVAYGVAL